MISLLLSCCIIGWFGVVLKLFAETVAQLASGLLLIWAVVDTVLMAYVGAALSVAGIAERLVPYLTMLSFVVPRSPSPWRGCRPPACGTRLHVRDGVNASFIVRR